MTEDANDGDERITFRVDPSKKKELKRLISLAKGKGELDPDASMSSLLQEHVDELLEELREEADEEGNRIAATAD